MEMGEVPDDQRAKKSGEITKPKSGPRFFVLFCFFLTVGADMLLPKEWRVK